MQAHQHLVGGDVVQARQRRVAEFASHVVGEFHQAGGVRGGAALHQQAPVFLAEPHVRARRAQHEDRLADHHPPRHQRHDPENADHDPGVRADRTDDDADIAGAEERALLGDVEGEQRRIGALARGRCQQGAGGKRLLDDLELVDPAGKGRDRRRSGSGGGRGCGARRHRGRRGGHRRCHQAADRGRTADRRQRCGDAALLDAVHADRQAIGRRGGGDQVPAIGDRLAGAGALHAGGGGDLRVGRPAVEPDQELVVAVDLVEQRRGAGRTIAEPHPDRPGRHLVRGQCQRGRFRQLDRGLPVEQRTGTDQPRMVASHWCGAGVAVAGGVFRGARILAEMIDQHLVGRVGRVRIGGGVGVLVAVVDVDRRLRTRRNVGEVDPDQGHLVDQAVILLHVEMQRRAIVAGHETDVAAVVLGAGEVEIARVQPQQDMRAPGRLRDVGALCRGVDHDPHAVRPVALPPRLGMPAEAELQHSHECDEQAETSAPRHVSEISVDAEQAATVRCRVGSTPPS